MSEMNETKAREILGESIQDDGCLHNEVEYVYWDKTGKLKDGKIVLDGEYRLEQLEAICWWVNHKSI